MRTNYVVRSGGRPVSLQAASSAAEALKDYLRALGCPDGEMVRLGSDAVAWRGAVYRAVPSDAQTLRAV